MKTVKSIDNHLLAQVKLLVPSETEVQQRASAEMWSHPTTVKELQFYVAVILGIDLLCVRMSLHLLDLLQMGIFSYMW